MKPLPIALVTSPGSSETAHTDGWRAQRPRFLHAHCSGCDLCAVYCPEGVVFRVAAKEYDYLLDFCKGCGICAEECPDDDIVMEQEPS